MELLLSDEKEISLKDLEIRKKLCKEFSDLPVAFLSKMRHLQPQVGCFNNCGFCAKFSVCKSEYWPLDSLRNIISAVKYTARNYTKDDLLLAWDRKEHRVGVVFPYLNNDIGSYPHLKEFVDLCYVELGARTRISTAGFSRHNELLNKMHKDICSSESIYALAGVRLSVCQYGRVWEDKCCQNSLDDYKKDLANFFNIYKPYYDKFGSGNRKMCVELRYNPLVVNADIFEFTYNNKYVIAFKNYLFISKCENIKLEYTYLTDPYKHSLEFTNPAEKFLEYNLDFDVTSIEQLTKYLDKEDIVPEKEVDLYLFNNKDGDYYSINPKLTTSGNYGINIYPKVGTRKNSGYIVTERFFLNALYNFKKKKGLELKDKYPTATYDDITNVINILEEYSRYYSETGKNDKSSYIIEHVIPLLSVYIEALKMANYPASVFFDKNFTIDTGIICNLGRALGLFKGLSSYINEPLTPTHERNYGRHCSTMKQENYVWLLGCDFNDTILIEKLDLFNTASVEGQVSYTKKITIDGFNKKISNDEKYLYPGEVL